MTDEAMRVLIQDRINYYQARMVQAEARDGEMVAQGYAGAVMALLDLRWRVERADVGVSAEVAHA